MNQALVIISPVILVRLLSVEQFGRYREFLLYAGLAATIAAFGIKGSLLRFVPGNPSSGWRFVNQAVVMTFASSVIVTIGMLALDALFDGKLVGDFAIPVALYVLFYVNMDFWEPLWLAERRGFAVLQYSTVRLVARIAVVTTSAWLSRDVATIIVSLLCLEALRLIVSAIGWIVRARTSQTAGPSKWREQLQYCLPFGAALVLIGLNRSLGSLLVAKMLGAVALAHYVIGTYLQPFISIIRNSISDVVLPEMASRNGEKQTDPLGLWRRTTVLTAILLLASGVLLARFADVLIVTLFSEQYRPAVVLFQLYTLVFVRETLDFGVPLRAINRTAPILHSNLIAIAFNATLMFILMPIWGASGAVAALVVSRFIEGGYLATRMARAYGVPLRLLAPWKDLLKVVGAAVLAAAVLYGQFWTERLGLAGVVLGGALYIVTFAFLLVRLRVPEAHLLLKKLRSTSALVLRRLHERG